MRFGPVPLEEAAGAILAHSLSLDDGGRIAKGVRLDADHLARLKAAGVREVTVARPEAGELGEDEAARRVATALAGPGLRPGPVGRGRADLLAADDGLLRIARTVLRDLAGRDERIAIATRPAEAPVHAGERVATVKIVPFAVPEALVEAFERTADRQRGAILSLAPFRRLRAVLVETFPAHRGCPPAAVGDKLRRVMEARLARLGARLERAATCRHETAALAATIQAIAEPDGSGPPDLLLIAGAGAIVDRRDVVPAALVRAGGRVERFGMPVEPGNLLMLGRLADTTVIGLPGCARSPAKSGLDLVLERLAAGLPLDTAAFADFAIGGLIAAAPATLASATPARIRRPAAPPAARHAALLLAAGSSRRFGPQDKLHAPLAGGPLIRHAARPLADTGLAGLFVVHRPEDRRTPAELADLGFRPVANPDHAEGIASSIRAGIAALMRAEEKTGHAFDGVLVMLADMPHVRAATVRTIVEAANEASRTTDGTAPIAFVPTCRGKRGHPVLFARAAWCELAGLTGDEGARHLLKRWGPRVREIDVSDPGILVDIDEQAALERLRRGRS